MKKLSLAILALLATKQIHAMNVESEIQCKYGNFMTLSFSGSPADDPQSRYQLVVEGDKTVYEGTPDTEEYANVTTTDFKFTSKEIYGGGFSKHESGTLEEFRYYDLNLNFTQIPVKVSAQFKKLTSKNSTLTFNCVQRVFNKNYE